MKICENCGLNNEGNYGSGRFCNQKCAKSYSTKFKRNDINKKVSETLLNKKIKPNRYCEYCGKILDKNKRKKIKTCNSSCASKLNWSDSDFRKKIVQQIREKCEGENERKRLRDIGKKGGFGKKGYTDNGVYFESSLEKKCYEFLDSNHINYIPHKQIPNSTKITDIFLIDYNIWIELDGINREKNKSWLKENYTYWLEKLMIYEEQNLRFSVIYNYDEFCNFINKLTNN